MGGGGVFFYCDLVPFQTVYMILFCRSGKTDIRIGSIAFIYVNVYTVF